MIPNKIKFKNGFIKIAIVLFISFFLLYQYYGYSSFNVDSNDHVTIQNTYNLNLEDENWIYHFYQKNTMINAKPSFYHIENPFISLFENGQEQFNTTVSIDVTDGEDIFEISLPAFVNGRFEEQVMVRQSVEHNNTDITVQLIKYANFPDLAEGYYIPKCQITFNYKDCLYHISFITPSEDLIYHESDKSIRLDELTIYLNYIDSILR